MTYYMIPGRSRKRPSELQRNRTVDTLDALHNEMSSLFSAFFDRPLRPVELGPVSPTIPRVDVSENEEEITIRAELPGLDEKNIDVSLNEYVLTIKGEREQSKERDDEEREYFVSERSYGAFERCFTLPKAIQRDEITAKFKNGLLELTVPKASEPEKEVLKIEVTED